MLLLIPAKDKTAEPKVDIESQSLLRAAVQEVTVENTAPPEDTPTAKEVTNIEQLYEVSTEASSFKSYMDYRALTDTSSTQYEMQQCAYTDDNGLRKNWRTFLCRYGNLLW